MIQHRAPGRGSIITRSSVHNSRAERTHRKVCSGVLVFNARIFGQLEDEGKLNVLDDLQILSLHHIYIPIIQNSLEELVRQINNRPVSNERNQLVHQMWERGMLQKFYSGHTPLGETEIEHFKDEDYQVEISPPLISLSDEQLAQLPHPLSDDGKRWKRSVLAMH